MLVADPHSPGFNTYASVADLRAFAAGRGYTVPADDDECGMLLMQAMDFLEGKAWCGQRFSTSQPLSWPRSGVRFDGIDLPDDTIPQRLVDAQCRLAIESQEIDLTPSGSGGGAVIAESVQGPSLCSTSRERIRPLLHSLVLFRTARACSGRQPGSGRKGVAWHRLSPHARYGNAAPEG